MQLTRALTYLVGILTVVPVSWAPAQVPPVVDNTRPIWQAGAGITLSSRPALIIGTQSGPMYEFLKIVGAAKLRDGRVVVADGASRSLRFFDATGKYLKSAGGPGEGPGEFQRLEAMWRVPGDTLVAGSPTGEVSYFTSSGTYIARRGVRQPAIPAIGNGRPVVLTPLDGSGRRVVAVLPRPDPKESRPWFVDSFPVAIVDPMNGLGARLGLFPALEMTTTRGEQRMARLSSRAVFAAGDQRFYMGFGSEYAIKAFENDGRHAYTIRRAWQPVKVTSSVINAFVEAWGKLWITSQGAAAEAERASLRNEPYAATVPAFAQFLVDRGGQLWVREAALADAPGNGAFDGTPLIPSKWSVFGPSGQWLGNVVMPARFLPQDIGTDYVLGTARDDDGVESIAIYSLVKATKP